MNLHKLITALLLMLPGLSWGQVREVNCSEFPLLCVSAPEPGMLALLGAGGVAAGLVWLIRRK